MYTYTYIFHCYKTLINQRFPKGQHPAVDFSPEAKVGFAKAKLGAIPKV